MKPIEKIIMALAIVLLTAITIAPFINGLVSYQPAYAESTEDIPAPTTTKAGSEANLPQVTTAQPQPTEVPTATERWGHGFEKTGYDICDQIHRDYNVQSTYRQESNGSEYCYVRARYSRISQGGWWHWIIPIDKVDQVDFEQLLETVPP